ncbi:methionine synthase reductase-like [Artemia franciscana]|uniref:methionine synthase reductase-like n=1 Tax=Artemia franciscana TaxID=6661 RepID=UPI0032D9CCD2
MAEYAQNEDEKRRLLELSSVEGAVEYTKLIKEANISLLDILETFKSSLPPIEKVLQQLPKMLPRAYSIVTSKLKDPDHLAFVFKIVEFPATDGRTRERKGVATGWISQLTSPLWKRASVEEQLGNLNLESIQLPIYQRTSTAFRLPQQLDTPIIMVGPGSGVAPFLGFLHQREELIKANPSQIVGPSWLFFGCRHENKDYLFRSELERLHGSGVLTRFYQAFSKEPSTGPRYVQDILRLYKRPLVTLLLDRGAVFYVCGDAKGMAKDVFETLADAIAEVKGLDIQDARATTAKLQLEKRYLQDVWS